MKRERQKNWRWPLLAAVSGGILGAVAYAIGVEAVIAALADFGQWLRSLSLSGSKGNTCAWLIVLAIAALPLLGLIWKERQRADWLLPLSAGQLLAALYFLVNPTLLSPGLHGTAASALGQGWGLVAVGAALGTLAVWALLRLLTILEQKPAKLLPSLLFCAAMLYAVLIGYSVIYNLLSEMASTAQGNTDAGRVAFSNALLILLAVLHMVPRLLAAWVLLWGGDLAEALDAAPFAEETVALAEAIARRCALVTRASLLVTVLGNLLQLLLFSLASAIHITVDLPLLTLALCAVLLLLCKYFRRSKAISDENDTII